MIFEMVEVKGRALCRYSFNCPHWQRNNPIPKGSEVLRITIGSAGGEAVALYCEKHTKLVLKEMKKIVDS